jgi:uncharacterized membrane protein YqjE
MKYGLSIEIYCIFSAFKESFGCALRLLLHGPIRVLFTIAALIIIELVLSFLFDTTGWMLAMLRSAATLYIFIVLAYTFAIWQDQKNNTYSA